MTFDWFTLVAQLVNFGLLLLLLRLFLYRPVLNVMEQREKRLADAWAEAKRVESEARAEADRLAQAHAELERERRARLDQIEAEARQLRQVRLAETERETAAERARRLAALEEGEAKLAARLRRRGADLVVDELRAALADLADARLETHVAEVFERRLAALPPEQRAALRTAAQRERPLITTAFALDEAPRERLSAAVARVTGAGEPPRFTTDELLLFGVELTVGALRVAVSGRERLASLDAAFQGALDGALAEAGASLASGGGHGTRT